MPVSDSGREPRTSQRLVSFLNCESEVTLIVSEMVAKVRSAANQVRLDKQGRSADINDARGVGSSIRRYVISQMKYVKW